MKQFINKTTFRHYFLFAFILTAFTLFFSNTVFAQDETTLAVLPAEAELELVAGETITIDMWVSNAVDVYAFDVTLTYDPAVLQLDSWAYGGFISGLFPMEQTNQPGFLKIAAAKMGQPGASGEGSLLRLTFSAVGLGETELTITDALFANDVGTKTYPTRIHGSLVVLPQRFNLSGTLSLQGLTEWSGVPVTLGTGQSEGYGPYNTTTSSQSSQNLLFEKVVGDTYQITTQQPFFLNVHDGMDVFVTVDSDITLPELNLKAGNAVWSDNVIDVSDASVVGAWYGAALEELDPSLGFNPDVNFDGIVNIQDLTLVASNYGLTSESAYADWLP